MKHDYIHNIASFFICTSQKQGVVLFPISTSRRSNHIVVAVTFTHTSVLTTSSSLTSQLTMLHHSLTDPVDSRISTNGFVHWVNHDYLIIQVGGILTDPVGVQNSESTCQSPSSFLSFRTSATLKFNLVDTLTFWLTVSCTFGDRLLTTTTSQSNTVDDVTLLGSV